MVSWVSNVVRALVKPGAQLAGAGDRANHMFSWLRCTNVTYPSYHSRCFYLAIDDGSYAELGRSEKPFRFPGDLE